MKAPVKSNPNWLNLKAVNASKAGTQKSTATVAKNTVNYSRLTPAEHKANQDSLYLYNTQKEFNNQFKKYFTPSEATRSKDATLQDAINAVKKITPSKEEVKAKTNQTTRKETATNLVSDTKDAFSTVSDIKNKSIIELHNTGYTNENRKRFPKEYGKSEHMKLQESLKNKPNSTIENTSHYGLSLTKGSFIPNSVANNSIGLGGDDTKNRIHGINRVRNKDVIKNTEYSETTLGENNNGNTTLFEHVADNKNDDKKVRRYFIPHYDVVHDKIKPIGYEKYYQSLPEATIYPTSRYDNKIKRGEYDKYNKNFDSWSNNNETVSDPSSFRYDDVNQANSKLPIYKKPREVIYDDKETPVSKSPTKIPVKPVLKKPIEETKRETYTPPIEIQSRGIVTQQPTLPLKEPTPFNIIPIKPTFVKEDISKDDTIAPTKTKSKVGLLDFLNENKKTERVSFGSRGNKPTNQHKGGWYNTRR